MISACWTGGRAWFSKLEGLPPPHFPVVLCIFLASKVRVNHPEKRYFLQGFPYYICFSEGDLLAIFDAKICTKPQEKRGEADPPKRGQKTFFISKIRENFNIIREVGGFSGRKSTHFCPFWGQKSVLNFTFYDSKNGPNRVGGSDDTRNPGFGPILALFWGKIGQIRGPGGGVCPSIPGTRVLSIFRLKIGFFSSDGRKKSEFSNFYRFFDFFSFFLMQMIQKQ